VRWHLHIHRPHLIVSNICSCFSGSVIFQIDTSAHGYDQLSVTMQLISEAPFQIINNNIWIKILFLFNHVYGISKESIIITVHDQYSIFKEFGFHYNSINCFHTETHSMVNIIFEIIFKCKHHLIFINNIFSGHNIFHTSNIRNL